MNRMEIRVSKQVSLASALVAVWLLLTASIVSALPDSGRSSTGTHSPSPMGAAAWPVSSPRVGVSSTYTVFAPIIFQFYGGHNPFSVQLYGSLNASSGFNQAVIAGVSWARVQAQWSEVEPSQTTPSNYKWAALDASIQAATAAGTNLILTLENNPAWAAKSPHGPVTNTADLQEFVGAIVARYQNVKYWELYNEPDNIHGAFGNNGAGYAAMLNAIYPVIKAANPAAQVVMGGLAMDWYQDQFGSFERNFLDHVLQSCAQPCFDIANFHYYPVFRGEWEPYGRDIIGKANSMRLKLAQYGFDRPVISTETGWSYTNWGGNDFTIQDRYVTKTYVRGMATGMSIINWYAMLDVDLDLPGLLGGIYPRFVLRPSYQALQRLTSLLGRAQYLRTLSTAETGSPYVEGYVFSTLEAPAPRRIDVVWYDCPSLIVYTGSATPPFDCNSTAPYRVAAARIGVMNHLTGTMTIYTDADLDGWITLPNGVNTNPLYIVYDP